MQGVTIKTVAGISSTAAVVCEPISSHSYWRQFNASMFWFFLNPGSGDTHSRSLLFVVGSGRNYDF